MNLKEQFNWYIENQQDLVDKYNGKILVIKDKEVAGVYESEDIALLEATQKFGLGNFIIQLCTPGKDAYTQTFHSRVVFA